MCSGARPGDFVSKPMSSCSGREVMTELLGHLRGRRGNPGQRRPRRHCAGVRSQPHDHAQHPAEPGVAFANNAIGIPVAAGVRYPTFAVLLSPVVTALAMPLSPVSVISKAVRLQAARL